MFDFLVTTKLDRLPSGPIVMLDGTVPGWRPNSSDRHYDHHRPGGAKVQIHELPKSNFPQGSRFESFMTEVPAFPDAITIVTTQVDADACVAAAYWLLDDKPTGEIYQKLEAIAFDCDYLGVPDRLSDLADFAAQAVAALKMQGDAIAKELNLPPKRDDWDDLQREAFYSECFKQGTFWLIEACNGDRKFPGEEGEAAQYWAQVQADIEMLLSESRIEFIEQVGVAHLEDISRYIDPRAVNAAILRKAEQLNFSISDISSITLVGRLRKDKKGTSYTLGTLTQHPCADKLDYSNWQVWAWLTMLERAKNSDFDAWGGRAAVGGSSWNDPSSLSSQEVVDGVLDWLSVVLKQPRQSVALFDF